MPPEGAAAHGAPGGGDRLSGLPDRVLLRVLSHLKAWEAVRTCVLSRRWRNLWASASGLDIRQPCGCHGAAADDMLQPEAFATFVKNLLLRRRPFAPLDSLRLCWSHEDPDGDANFWIAYAVRHGAEEIELSGEHHHVNPTPEYTSFIYPECSGLGYCNLRILKLSRVKMDDTTLRQLCSRCTSLEELELNDWFMLRTWSCCAASNLFSIFL
ncbi:F-box protein At5g03100-like [Panicum hallii]|uniref:F-box protein At5g03100-like n=1 Tax=Panicum hallii TaxID=206008 RepID=UPI000DF4E36C|nr:F-box protein At5g03100-like [Panicum hallii]